MIDISKKKELIRKAIATGRIYLREETIEKIKNKGIKKGDVLETARIVGTNAVKQTQLLIPYCHQIPIDFIDFNFILNKNSIEVRCVVKSVAKTGLEMESLVGVSLALNTIWDMVKYLEKNENGQYPNTKISEIRILEKIKEKQDGKH